MKWKHWNYFRMGTLIFLQALSVTILLAPWLQWSAHWFDFLPSQSYLWVIMSTTAANLFVKFAEGQGTRGYWGLGSAAVVNLGLMAVFDLPLALFGPLLLILILLAVRFSFYPQRVQFKHDWAWATLFLIGTTLLQPKLGLHVGLGHVLLFFGSGVVMLILWNTHKAAAQGLETSFGSLSRMACVFLMVTVVLSGLLAAILSPEVLKTMVGWLKTLYLGVVEVFVSVIVTPLAWLLSPLFRWAENAESQPVEIQVPEIERIPFEPLTGQDLPAETVTTLASMGWVIFTAVLVICVLLVFRTVLRKRKSQVPFKSVEVRESVFSKEELLTDLKNVIRGVTKPFRVQRRVRLYTGDDPVLKVRSIYARFVLGMKKTIPYEAGCTPLEYQDTVTQEVQELNCQALDDLTALYNQARYGETANQDDVRLAQKAVQDMK